jgi:DNA invertase Pin-like site-specific DNA recombinase
MSYTAAYLRKSRSDDPTREVSRDVQEQAVRDLAARDGRHDVRLFVDWDRSGDDAKVSRRAAYQSMVKALKAGELDAIYAYDASRLYRGIGTFHDLMAASSKAEVPVVTARDGVIGGDGSPMAKAYSQIGAVFAELELNTAKARAKSAAESRRRRGDHLGNVPYGYRLERSADGMRLVPREDQPIAPILDAWERAGRRVRTCARILNDELHIPASRGGAWDRPSLLRLIAREAPDRLPRRAPNGRREEPPTPAILAKLLMCHCGRTLTPNRHKERRPGRGHNEQMSYYCARGNAGRENHPRVYVAEAVLMPWLKAEAARLRVPERVQLAETSGTVRSALEERRQRIIDNYEDGLVSREQRDAKLALVADELDRLDTAETIVDVPALDWSWSPETINAVLRAIWHHVELDESMRPVRAEWRLPAEYVA